jgi:hypothetical protein
MLLVQCRQGGEHVYIAPEDGNRDPHSRLDEAGCTHCTLGLNADPSHHCGQHAVNADACEAANHPGKPCWHPPGQPDRPDGCTVCRPVLIELPRGSIQVGV